MARKKKENAVKTDENREEEVKTDCLMLPKKALFRVDEVARYFDVTEQTIRLWVSHGHLEADKIVGVIRVTRESILKCRFRNRLKII